MKKICVVFLIVLILLTTGCGKKGERDIINDLEDKIDKFGVFTYFDTTQIKPASTIINTMKFADYTLY